MKFHHKVTEKIFPCDIKSMEILGKFLIVCLKNKQVQILHSANFELIREFTLDFVSNRVLHPITYLNKVLFHNEKTLQLVNFNTSQVIYDFKDSQLFAELLEKESIKFIKNS